MFGFGNKKKIKDLETTLGYWQKECELARQRSYDYMASRDSARMSLKDERVRYAERIASIQEQHKQEEKKTTKEMMEWKTIAKEYMEWNKKLLEENADLTKSRDDYRELSVKFCNLNAETLKKLEAAPDINELREKIKVLEQSREYWIEQYALAYNLLTTAGKKKIATQQNATDQK
jgi:hypothetical protein